jgi:exopolysaccharide production protein ExoQ
MSTTIFAVFGTYILWLFLLDARRRDGISPAIWSVVAWATLLGSRPVSTWFSVGGGEGSAESYDEGNPFERSVYFVLIFHGLFVLARRSVRFREVVASNRWLVVFFGYWALSIFWADDSFVAFKRWIKDLGNIVMVLVVLTDAKPMEAMKAVFVRSASLLLPMSVLFILFIPEFGRTYHVWTGEMMYTGVTTHKNSLGVLVLISLMFLVWDFTSRPPPGSPSRSLVSRLGELSLILMGGWLLMKAGSATASGCCVVGLSLMFLLSWKALRNSVAVIEFIAVAGTIILWPTGLAQSIVEYFIVDILGRDLTLTSRTDVWPMLLSKADNVLVGSGFNSFWTGDRLAEVYGQLGIIQAHNGYLETYLNGGLVGLGLLVLLLLSAIRQANKQLAEGGAAANVAFAMILINVVYNFTEASFDKTSPLWFAFLMVLTQYRDGRSPVRSDRVADEDAGTHEAAPPRRFPAEARW